MEVKDFKTTAEFLEGLKNYAEDQIKSVAVQEATQQNTGYLLAMNGVLRTILAYIDINNEQNKIVAKEKGCKEVNEVKDDPVNHPSHYTDGNIEVITYIEDKGLIEGFCKGNAIKYISRAGKKESAALQIDEKEIQDIKKARWYLDYLISYYERKKGEK